MLACAALALLGACATQEYFRDAGNAPASPAIPLERWPHPEVWTGVVFNGEKVGFTRRAVRAATDAPGRFEIESEAAIRLRFLGIDKRLALRSLDRVRADLTLESFRYSHEIDGSSLEVEGTSDRKVLEFSVRNSSGVEQHSVPLDKPLYPSSVLTMLPAAKGLAVGDTASYAVFNGETQSVAEAEQEVQAWQSSEFFAGLAFRVLTRLHGLETLTWISPDGRPLFERGLNGVMISALEDEARARRYLVEASLSRQDALVDFSLLRAGPIKDPRRVSRLEIALEDVPPGFAVPQGGGQRCSRAGRRLDCIVDRAAPPARDDPARYLKATLAAPSNLGEIKVLASRISQGEKDPDKVIASLLAWIDANIAKEAIDGFSAVDVLRERRAECQGHSYLLAAFARALAIPARIVNGIVYSEAHGGFLYHTWNELWIEGSGWRPVDATFAQAHADATHLRLLEGETAAELLPLATLVGRIRVASVSAVGRW